MSEPNATPSSEPKTPLPRRLLAVGILGFFILSVSLAGLWWWLLHRTDSVSVSKTESLAQPTQPAQPVEKQMEGSVTELFNGADLDGWDFDPTIWSVRNGVIYGNQRRSGYGSSLFWHEADLGDFELRFSFRLIRGNSGVYYRANPLDNYDVGGYEFEIYTNRVGNLSENGTDREKRRLYRTETEDPPIDSQWHEGAILATGRRLVHTLDGQVVCDLEDQYPAAPRTGVIAFANGQGTIVEFKDIRLKRRKTTP